MKEKSILEVSVPSGRTLKTDKLARTINLDIKGKTLEADFYLIEMNDFDVILGIDWLGSNHATIRCREMEVSFQKPRKEQFSFLGRKTKPHLRLVSALKAKKMLMKETCQVFLVNISGEK